jgi:hypothetical protein
MQRRNYRKWSQKARLFRVGDAALIKEKGLLRGGEGSAEEILEKA